ncbi:hypothetical protein PFNF135_06294, partial [Plasmodium falciparum NF135/5.C10]
KFAQTPQFLRWFTEWGEDFCKQRDVKVKELVKQCTGYDCGNTQNGKKEACKNACKKYQEWLKKWRENYDKQKVKFKTDKEGYNDDPDTIQSTEAYEYLGKKLKNITFTSGTTNGDCNCMKEKSKQESHDGSITDSMPASLDDEPEEVRGKCTCPPTPPKAQPGGAGRSGTFTPPEEEEEEEEEVDENEEEEDEDDNSEDTTENKDQEEEETPPGPQDQDAKEPEAEAPPTDHKLNVCSIVDGILTKDNLEAACKQKYDGKYYGWKCVTPSGKPSDTGSSGATTGGSICVPPRRRKLYVGKLQEWATKTETQEDGKAQTQTSDQKTPSDKLRDAFIKSAAIETFFLWDRYKKEWTAQKLAEQEQSGLLLGGVGVPGAGPPQQHGSESDNPQNQLKRGTIPPDFLRQMFYTLGDYRDIYVGNTDIVSKASSDDKKSMETIEKKIEQILPKNGDTPPPGQNSDKRTALWGDFAQDIWNGMICALTYKENGSDKPQVDDKVKGQLFESDGKKPKDTYKYTDVKLNENSGPMHTTQTPSHSGDDPLNNPKLTQFVERPPYFRYLEEWGQNFCKERKKRLEKIKVDCEVDENTGGRGNGKVCSGYGEDCKKMLDDDYDTVPSFEYPGCATSCSSYRKWIKGKRKEYDEQQNAYNEQKNSYQRQRNGAGRNNNDNEFYTKLEKNWNTAASFLQSLKVSCKNDSGNDDIKTEFSNPEITFRPAKNCDPCSEFNVNCKNCNGGGTKVNCNGGKISAENINNSTDINMLVSDDSATEFKDGLSECKDKGIFKGIRKDEWTCEKVCGYVVCKPKKVNGETVTKEKDNGKHIVQIRALLRLWLEYFLEDYKKIKHKISHCTKNREVPTCINGCVEKWVEEKRKEWENIKKRFLEQYKNKDSDNSFPVKTILEELIPQIGAANEKNYVIKLSKFGNSCACSASASSTNGNEDAIDCMLQKLQKKIDDCKNKPSGTDCHPSTPVEDDDEPLEEEKNTEEAKKMMPKICKDVVQEAEAVDEGGCTPDVKKEEEKKEEKKKPEQTPILKPEEEAPAPEDTEKAKPPEPEAPPAATPKLPKPPKPQRPRRPRRTLELLDNPPFKTALMSSTIMWSIGIGFAALTYFLLKVNESIYMYVFSVGVRLDICICFIYIYVFIIEIEKKKKKEKGI